MKILEGYLFSYLFLFGVIFGAGILKKLFKLPSEWSRKIVHIFISFTWIFLYKYLYGTIHFVVVPLSFVIINYFSYKFKIFKMFEREEDDGNHYGTVWYPLSMTIMAIISNIWSVALIPYGIGVFCLSFGDGAAALIGPMIKKYNFKITKEKSFFGTLSCVVFSFVGIMILSLFVPLGITLWQAAIIGVASGVLELVGGGYDNFSVPGGVMALSLLFLI